ncbi:MAG: helix-turn-helix transcriptional regulator [Planctomycetota bacterium]|jgi:excisionase family DNA binding protein
MKTELNGKHLVIPERYVDIKTVSRYTSLPVKSLYELAGTGRIPSIKLGRRILFDLNDIDQVMSSLKRTNNQEETIVNKIVGGINVNNI